MMIPSTFFESPPVLSEPFKPSKLRALFRRTVYFGVRRRSIFAWCYETNRLHRDVPTAAVTKDGKTWRFGEASPAAGPVPMAEVETFNHPRVVVSDVAACVKLIRYFSDQVMKPKPMMLNSSVVFQYLDDVRGGLAQCERKAMIDACCMAGFGEVLLLGPEHRFSERQIVELCRDVKTLPRLFKGEEDYNRFLDGRYSSSGDSRTE